MVEPTRIYHAKSAGFVPANVVDCGWVASTERIHLSEAEMLQMAQDEMQLLERFVQETARNAINTELHAEYAPHGALTVIIEHGVPCVTQMEKIDRTKTRWAPPIFQGPIFDEMYADRFTMYNQYGKTIFVQDNTGIFWDGLI